MAGAVGVKQRLGCHCYVAGIASTGRFDARRGVVDPATRHVPPCVADLTQRRRQRPAHRGRAWTIAAPAAPAALAGKCPPVLHRLRHRATPERAL